MGPGDAQLTPDDGIDAAEAETRRLLGRYGEPRAVQPPADLALRVLDTLADPGLAQTGSRLRRIYGGVILVCVVALLALGAWGVLVDSSGPAHLFGDVGGGLGELLLLLTLAAKPLINLLLTAGVATAAVIAAIAVGSWLWWLLLRRELAASLEASV